MKILYAIQGTGNGHIARSVEIIPQLQRRCTVDLLISGSQSGLRIRYPVKYRLQGLGFVFGNKGGVDIWKTFSETSISRFRDEVLNLPVEEYDFVINDFEPVSAWACYNKKVPCYSLSHQASLLTQGIPKPGKIDFSGRLILKYYAPATDFVGFHFASYNRKIFTPVIRKDIRTKKRENFGHYTVYLPSYSDTKIQEMLGSFEHIRWQVFSKRCFRTQQSGNIVFYPVSQELFTKSLVTCNGILCGAGFETPAEALYLGKKLLVIPMKNQIEQHFNAAALKMLGVPVIKKLSRKNLPKIENWLKSDHLIKIDYPDNTKAAVNRIFEYYLDYLNQKTVSDKYDFNKPA